MSLLMLAGGAARAGLATKIPGAVGKIFGRKGRKRARAAAAAAAAQPTLAQRALGIAREITGLPAGRRLTAMGMPVRRRRARGISGTEIRGFKKVSRLLAQFGMRPRGLARPMARGRRPFSRARFGDVDFGDDG